MGFLTDWQPRTRPSPRGRATPRRSGRDTPHDLRPTMAHPWHRSALHTAAWLCPLGLAAAATALLTAPGAAQATSETAVRAAPGSVAGLLAPPRQAGGWLVEWTPYVWAAGLDGEVGIRGRTASVDLGFTELLKKLDGALFLPVEMRKGRWGTGIEVILVKLSDQAGTPGPVFDQVKASADQTVLEISPRYRVAERQPVAVDLLSGGRLWHLTSRLTFTTRDRPDLLVEAGERWIDPFIGARVIADLGRRWSVRARGDFGGFGIGSDLTWNLLGGVGYLINDRVALRAGYRHLAVDFRDEQDGFTFDIATSGWILGVSIQP